MFRKILRIIADFLSPPVIPEQKAEHFPPDWWMTERDLERIKKEVLG